MTFAADKWVPTKYELAAAIAEVLVSRALPMEWGGTGVKASGLSDAERALDILKTWGMLDSGDLVPLALIPTALPLTSILAANETTPILDFEQLGDAACRLYTAAAGSGGRKARLGTRSSVDTHVELVLEPAGNSGVSIWGDQVNGTLRPMRGVFAQPMAATFSTVNLPAPIIDSPGSPQVNLLDVNGSYVSLTYDFAAGLPSGIWIPNATRRFAVPSLTVVFRSVLIQSRIWFGMFSADPAGSNTLGTIKGVGVRHNADTDTNQWQFVTSDGTTQTTTATGIAPTANAIQALRVRHLGASVWEFATYNFTTRTWENFVEQSTTSPAGGDVLGLALRLDSTSSASNRAMSPKLLALSAG